MSTELKDVVLIQGVFRKDFFGALSQCKKDVVVLEGRPNLEAAHDACKHLQKAKIVPTVMADNMAGYLFSKGFVKEIWLAAQANDKAGAMCEIGALILAVLAKKHSVPVFTFPAGKKNKPFGKPADLQKFNGQSVVTGKVKAFVPLNEWVPAKYIKKNYE
ncbi:MAG: hypothetical protein IT395_00855 [Candidatus Omnitrophica bacterium]|nr:hypothetical protein [Candidatus Omnitrophota bacterium]